MSLARLRAARQAVGPHIHRTPMTRSDTLSRMIGADVWLKCELFQKTGSYKPRGMLWALKSLTPEERARGVITFSAGNAAQGLAFAAAIEGIAATVVMPATASPTKAAATRGYGAEVILHGTPQECLQRCLELTKERGLTFISSYDNEALMEGHASLGLEVLDDLPDCAAIYVGIGGGGMAGGLAKAAVALDHPVTLIGVEPTGAPAMRRSLNAGAAVRLDTVSSIADGLAAPSAGEACYIEVRDRFEDVLLVEDAAIADAMRLLMSRCKLFAEPAGSAALAGLVAQAGRWTRDQAVVVVVSGGNVDLDRLKLLL